MDDKSRKLQIVLVTASLGLVGFFLEVGPVGGAFGLAVGGRPVLVGLLLGLQGLGFLPYLALAMSAAVGLHLGEEEPRPEPEEDERRPAEPGQAEVRTARRAPVRPEVHQLRMILVAVLGYVALKALALALQWPAAQRMGIEPGALTRTFAFGLAFIGVGWLILWHLLRWFARAHQWVRLQTELVGVDAPRALAVLVAALPLWLLLTRTAYALSLGATGALSIALFLAAASAGAVLWVADPARPRRTVVGVAAVALIIVVLTIALAAAGG